VSPLVQRGGNGRRKLASAQNARESGARVWFLKEGTGFRGYLGMGSGKHRAIKERQEARYE